MHDYGWSDENTAVVQKPMSEKDKAAEARRVEEREQRRLSERANIRERIAASEQSGADAAELAGKRDDATAELESLQRTLTQLESQIDGTQNDDAIFSEQANVAEAITRLRAQRDAFHRQYLSTARAIDPTAKGDLFRTGRPDLVATSKVRAVVCSHLERGLNGLRSDRGRYSFDQFAILENAYVSELSFASSRAAEATAAVVDE